MTLNQLDAENEERSMAKNGVRILAEILEVGPRTRRAFGGAPYLESVFPVVGSRRAHPRSAAAHRDSSSRIRGQKGPGAELHLRLLL